MILFFISLLLVFAASYFITSIFAEKNSPLGIIYLLVSAFANVVVTFEILSLFSMITQWGVLILNVLICLVAYKLWKWLEKPLWKLDVKDFFCKFINAVKLDKYLLVLSVGFVVLIGVSVFLMSFMPVVNLDAGAYHVLRSVFWVTNKNLNHFSIADSRNLILPINSEILYAWVILFVKRLCWFGFFSFAGYILSVVSVYNILSLMNFGFRRKLWVIFILSAFSSVLVQISSTETDIIIAGLVTSSLYLFWYSVKNNKKVPIFFAALAYALAVGTKTPALTAVPAVGIAMTALSVYYLKKDFYKPILSFLYYSFFNFIIFSSYNYILNFIDYGNFLGSDPFMQVHRNQDGLLAIPANFIKYFFMFFDFTGFHWADFWGDKIISVRDALLSFLGLSNISDGLYNASKMINKSLLEPLMGLGVLGILVYLPCWLWSLIKPIFSKRKQTYFVFAFALMLVINIAVLSYQLQFMVYSIRFLMFFCVLSAPVLVYSYCKKNNFYKFIVVAFALFYMILASTHLWARPFLRIVKYMKKGYSVTQIREIATCGAFLKNVNDMPDWDKRKEYYNEACTVNNYIRENIDKRNKILYFSNSSADVLSMKMMEFEGYNIDFAVAEIINEVNLNKYNIIMTIFDEQFATNIRDFDKRKTDIYISPVTHKIYYRANPIVPCFYLNIQNKIITDLQNADDRAYMARCIISQNFYEMNNFKKIDELVVDIPPRNDGEEMIKYGYYFYENLNNPVIK